MSWVKLQRNGVLWEVKCLETRPDCVIINTSEAEYLARVNATVTRSVSDIQLPLWQLEFAKYASQNLAIPLGAAFDLIDAKQKNSEIKAYAVFVSRPKIAAQIVTRILIANGEYTTRVSAISISVMIKFIFGGLLALGNWIVTIVLYARQQPEIPFCTNFICVIYGELSNRTKHLLPPKMKPELSLCYMIIGRPHGKIETIAKIIDPENLIPAKRVFRAISWSAAFKSLPKAIGLVLDGFKVALNSPISLPLREHIAIIFRFLQGSCEARWWHEQNMPTKTVAFGLTGLAETTLLEWAIQESGAKTIHCVHGSSLGWNFAAYSDIGLFTCGYDADMAKKFPAYKSVTSISLPKPVMIKGDRRWLVMTSYTHPMNPHCINAGAAPDLAVLDMVMETAKMFGKNPSDIIWKPHPILDFVDPLIRKKLEKQAVEYGFVRWPKGMPYSKIANFGVIMTTPSTSAIDALNYGKLPILLASVLFQSDIVYKAFPLIACNDQELEQCINVLNDPIVMARQYQQVWDTVRPGDAVKYDYLKDGEIL